MSTWALQLIFLALALNICSKSGHGANIYYLEDGGGLVVPGGVPAGVLTAAASEEAPTPKILPGFIKLAHGVSSGPVTILDSRTIHISNLKYDGAGPDAYFWVGTGSVPSHIGRKIRNERGSSAVLKGYSGEDVELTLPEDLTVNDIDWLSIWCVAFRENFGYVKIPKNLNVPDYQ